MLFSAATTFVVYWLARALYDRATAIAAAALLAVSPLFWFYGSVGLTYAGEAFGASLVACCALGALDGRGAHLYLGALALGLVGGMRQSVSCCSSRSGSARRCWACAWPRAPPPAGLRSWPPCSPGSCR